jgi:hypothetical protein
LNKTISEVVIVEKKENSESELETTPFPGTVRTQTDNIKLP